MASKSWMLTGLAGNNPSASRIEAMKYRSPMGLLRVFETTAGIEQLLIDVEPTKEQAEKLLAQEKRAPRKSAKAVIEAYIKGIGS